MSIEDRFAYDSFRPGQKELATKVYDSCKEGRVLVAEAMSGFGKTAAVLAGTLTAADEVGSKVVYVCRTKRQINRVVEEVSRLQRKHPFKAASLLSKFDYCLLRRQRPVPRESFGWYCNFNTSNNLCSYFLNVPLAGADFQGAVDRFMTSARPHNDLLRDSERIHVCPYEVARLGMAQADLAVAPYHYVFDPRTSPILFDNGSIDRKRTILVVDEAHNLRDFLRGINSCTITLEEIRWAINEAQVLLMDEASASLSALQRTLEEIERNHTGWQVRRDSVLERFREDKGAPWLQNLAFELNSCSAAAWGSITYERRLPSAILRVGHFVERLTSAQDAILVKWQGTFGLIDPNPVRGLLRSLEDFSSAVLLSATVNPSKVFMRSLGLSESAATAYETPTEPLVTIKTAIDKGVSTRYKLRTPETFAKISDRLAAVVGATPKGVGIFVPSYAVLGMLLPMMKRRVTDRALFCEERGLSSQDADDIFDAFSSGGDSVLFAVQGGRFSEGEDFRGDSMGAVVVVGLSLPPPSPMLYAEYACLKQSGETDSYLMLSRLPALRKAFQAAGRHVRNPGKKGLVVLMDERFGSDAVRGLMPSWLRKDLVVGDMTPWALESLTSEFWGSPS